MATDPESDLRTAGSSTHAQDRFEDVDLFTQISRRFESMGVSKPVADAFTLQLAGTPTPLSGVAGEIRSQIHIAVFADASSQVPWFAKQLQDQFPELAQLFTGGSLTVTDLVGKRTSDDSASGALFSQSGSVIIHQAGDLEKDARTILEQVLDVGGWTPPNSSSDSFRESDCGVMFLTAPESGEFLRYDGRRYTQCSLNQGLWNRVDAILTESMDMGVVDTDARQDSTGGVLSDDEIVSGVREARTFSPALTDDATKRIQMIASAQTYTDDTEIIPVLFQSESVLSDSITRYAAAHARLRFSDSITGQDIQCAEEFLYSQKSQLDFNHEDIDFDEFSIVSSQEVSEEDAPQHSIRGLLKELQTDIDRRSGGVPIDSLIEYGVEEGISKEKMKHEIEKMKETGEFYEPVRGEILAA